jgi:hypothetical protein
MSSSEVVLASRPWVSNRTAQDILVYTHFSSPIILLALFLIAFTAHSIITSSDEAAVEPSTYRTGPGGKLLPPNTKGKRRKNALDFSHARKLLFIWLSVGVSVTFVANAGVVILHAVLDRKDNWWCGESVAVRCISAGVGCFNNLELTEPLDLRYCLVLCLQLVPHILSRH